MPETEYENEFGNEVQMHNPREKTPQHYVLVVLFSCPWACHDLIADPPVFQSTVIIAIIVIVVLSYRIQFRFVVAIRNPIQSKSTQPNQTQSNPTQSNPRQANIQIIQRNTNGTNNNK